MALRPSQVETEAAAHPVWSSDNEAIKDEFRRLEADRDQWLNRHRRVDTEAERFQEALEAIAALPPDRASDGPQIAASALERSQLGKEALESSEHG
jgi:hypothetical protein